MFLRGLDGKHGDVYARLWQAAAKAGIVHSAEEGGSTRVMQEEQGRQIGTGSRRGLKTGFPERVVRLPRKQEFGFPGAEKREVSEFIVIPLLEQSQDMAKYLLEK